MEVEVVVEVGVVVVVVVIVALVAPDSGDLLSQTSQSWSGMHAERPKGKPKDTCQTMFKRGVPESLPKPNKSCEPFAMISHYKLRCKFVMRPLRVQFALQICHMTPLVSGYKLLYKFVM